MAGRTTWTKFLRSFPSYACLAKKSFEPDSGTGEEKKGKSDSAIKIVALAAYLKEKKATWSKDGKQFYVTDKGFEELEK